MSKNSKKAQIDELQKQKLAIDAFSRKIKETRRKLGDEFTSSLAEKELHREGARLLSKITFKNLRKNLGQILKRIDPNKNYSYEKERAIIEARTVDSEINQRARAYKRLQEENIKNRIKAKKSGDSPFQHPSISVEAYIEDFDSELSRTNIQSSNLKSLKFPFLKATIYFLNEQSHLLKEISFESSLESVSFTLGEGRAIKLCRNELTLIEQEAYANRTINERNSILDALSVLLYLSYAANLHKESQEHTTIEKLPFLEEKSEFIQEKQSEASEKKQRVIRVDFKKRDSNTLLKDSNHSVVNRKRQMFVRGHWRRQQYKNHMKLIWINPFWKGLKVEKKDSAHQQTYKITKNNN